MSGKASAKKDHRFYLSFSSIDEFDGAIVRNGPETGVLLNPTQVLAVGDRVSIQVAIKGVASPVNLEGRVLWRRVRAGPDMPAGVFVCLVERDRARLAAVLRYLRKGHKERRRHNRYSVCLPASYQTANGEHRSEARDLSREGAFLRCMGPLLTVGSRFSLDLFLDGPDGKATSLHARVAWIDYFEETKGMGILFEKGHSGVKKVHRFIDQTEKQLQRKKT